jgi:hypothetical protein
LWKEKREWGNQKGYIIEGVNIIILYACIRVAEWLK